MDGGERSYPTNTSTRWEPFTEKYRLPFYKKNKYSLVGKEGYEGFIFDNENGKYIRMDPVFPKKDDPIFIV